MVLAKIRRPFSLTLSGHHCMLIYRFYTFLTKPLLWIILHSKIWINYDSAIYECSWERWKVDVEDPGRSILTAPPQCPSQPLHSENHEKAQLLAAGYCTNAMLTYMLNIQHGRCEASLARRVGLSGWVSSVENIISRICTKFWFQ